MLCYADLATEMKTLRKRRKKTMRETDEVGQQLRPVRPLPVQAVHTSVYCSVQRLADLLLQLPFDPTWINEMLARISFREK
jgi:hypothetical protein